VYIILFLIEFLALSGTGGDVHFVLGKRKKLRERERERESEK
jgi:hypothetical protein